MLKKVPAVSLAVLMLFSNTAFARDDDNWAARAFDMPGFKPYVAGRAEYSTYGDDGQLLQTGVMNIIQSCIPPSPWCWVGGLVQTGVDAMRNDGQRGQQRIAHAKPKRVVVKYARNPTVERQLQKEFQAELNRREEISEERYQKLAAMVEYLEKKLDDLQPRPSQPKGKIGAGTPATPEKTEPQAKKGPEIIQARMVPIIITEARMIPASFFAKESPKMPLAPNAQRSAIDEHPLEKLEGLQRYPYGIKPIPLMIRR